MSSSDIFYKDKDKETLVAELQSGHEPRTVEDEFFYVSLLRGLSFCH
jgi:hypothetical protein